MDSEKLQDKYFEKLNKDVLPGDFSRNCINPARGQTSNTLRKC